MVEIPDRISSATFAKCPNFVIPASTMSSHAPTLSFPRRPTGPKGGNPVLTKIGFRPYFPLFTCEMLHIQLDRQGKDNY